MRTTLNKIRDNKPCRSGWLKLLRNLEKTKPDNEPISITTIIDSNGLDDALWCLRAVDGHEREMRLFAVDCARSVQSLITDPRNIVALDVAESHANGFASDNELKAAWAAARNAAWDAARAAAGDAARDAARAAAGAARDTAWAAARDAARAAAGAAAGTERDKAWDAAYYAALNVAWAAGRAAARAAAIEVQSDFLRIICAKTEQKD